MNKWKVGVFISIFMCICFVLFQQFTILELKWENENYSDRLKRIDLDLTSIAKSQLINQSKKVVLAKLKDKNPDIELFEYDMGVVHMGGIILGFDQSEKLKSISVKTY